MGGGVEASCWMVSHSIECCRNASGSLPAIAEFLVYYYVVEYVSQCDSQRESWFVSVCL